MNNKNTQLPKSRYLHHGGMRSHYADWEGTGQTVLLVHGNMRTSRSFDAVARSLNQSSHVLALDLIGHGDSTWIEEGYTFADRATDVQNFMAQKELDKVCAVGHSLGGVAIAMCAMSNPENFDKIILLEPMMEVKENPVKGGISRSNRPRRTYADLDELREVLQTHKVTKKWTPEVIEDVVQHETFFNEQNRVDIKWSPATLSSPEKRTDYLNLEPILRQISIPTLMVVSENGTKEFEKAFTLEKELDNLQTLVMSDTGHNMYMERPDTVARVVRDFANSLALPKTV